MLPFETGGRGCGGRRSGELIYLADPPGTSGHVVSLRVLALPAPDGDVLDCEFVVETETAKGSFPVFVTSNDLDDWPDSSGREETSRGTMKARTPGPGLSRRSLSSGSNAGKGVGNLRSTRPLPGSGWRPSSDRVRAPAPASRGPACASRVSWCAAR
ncbi:DUF5959 family protein [Streptomyces sp. WG4]|uniref:DUF5959 family protein n=1 Tax=Streptomyces sp. WG4 TaxID=3417649 RepID=UPI003CF8BB86